MPFTVLIDSRIHPFSTFKGLAHPAINFNTFPTDVAIVVLQKFGAEEEAENIKDIPVSDVCRDEPIHNFYVYFTADGFLVLLNPWPSCNKVDR